MATRLAVLADIHLSDATESAQYACVDWAIDLLGEEKPDLVVGLGDITNGAVAGARYFRQRIETTKLPFLLTLGNRDHNVPENSLLIERILRTGNVFANDDYLFIVLDSSRNRIELAEREAAEKALANRGTRRVVLLQHHPLHGLHRDEDSQVWLTQILEKTPVLLFVYGHAHENDTFEIGPVQAHVVAGLDPDKAQGGPPAVTFFELRGPEIHREERRFPLGCTQQWSRRERNEFTQLLGISCGTEPWAALDLATELNLRCLELGPEALEAGRSVLIEKLSRWRKGGGNHLGWRMPDLGWNPSTARITGGEGWQRALDWALELGAQSLSLRTPNVPVSMMKKGSPARAAVARFYGESLRATAERGLILAVENAHTAGTNREDTLRRLGCRPQELREWVAELRDRLPRASIGILLDVGNARHNAPFSNTESLGKWYAWVGRDALAYRIHQVGKVQDATQTHLPIESLFGNVSYSSFLWAWKVGQANRKPIFLRIDGGPEPLRLSLQVVQDTVARH